VNLKKCKTLVIYLKREKMDIETQLEIIKRGTEEIIPEDDLVAKLERSERENCPLRVKLGIDPTGPDIHLGHAVVIRKLRQFQDLGHTAILVVGDFTGRIGDPAGRSESRRQLTEEEIKENIATYKEQVFKILDPSKTEFCYNDQWLGKLTSEEIIRLASIHTVARMLERDDFAQRFREEKPIYIHEFLYALFQGYDSVAISADVELGGTEQKFNLLVGRELQREFGQEPQVAITMPILEGTDGIQRMGKSLKNYIGINESPREMFGKIMSIPDSIIERYFELATNLSSPELEEVRNVLKDPKTNPRDIKQHLAQEIVSMYHSRQAAEAASEEFERIFKEKGFPDEIETYELSWEKPSIGVIQLLVETKMASSKSEARRLIVQGGVDINSINISDPDYELSFEGEFIIKVGKRRFLRVIPKVSSNPIEL